MKQIITGPMGRVVYYNTCASKEVHYPSLNLPDRSFARADHVIAANHIYTPNVIQLSHQRRRFAVVASFDMPAKREV